MVGRLISFWDGLFSGAMLVLGNVHSLKLTNPSLKKLCLGSDRFLLDLLGFGLIFNVLLLLRDLYDWWGFYMGNPEKLAGKLSFKNPLILQLGQVFGFCSLFFPSGEGPQQISTFSTLIEKSYTSKSGPWAIWAVTKTLAICCIEEIIWPSFMGIGISYKNPYYPIRISWNVNRVWFTLLIWCGVW